MNSKMRTAGYLLIDHRESPGLTDAEAQAGGLGGMPVGKSRSFEADVLLCAHCQAGIILNPMRTRARAWCSHCDRYICDDCGAALAATGTCCNFDKLLDFVQDHNMKLADQGIQAVGLPDLSPLLTKVSITVPPRGE